METLWKLWNFSHSVTFWCKVAPSVLLGASRISRFWGGSLWIPCRIFILSITSRNSWLEGSSWKIKKWRIRIGTSTCPSSNRLSWTRKRRKYTKLRRKSIIHSHLNRLLDLKISRWKQVSISWLRNKSMKRKWSSRERNKRKRGGRGKSKDKWKMMRKNNSKKKLNKKKWRKIKNKKEFNLLLMN